MFAELMTALARGRAARPGRLRQWFRVALTKKMAVVRLLAPCEPRPADAAPAAGQAIGLSRNSRM